MQGRCGVPEGARPWARVAAGATAWALGDMIFGVAAFASISWVSLWCFSFDWITLRAEYLAHGLSFGTAWQVGLAWFGVIAAFPLLALTVILTLSAMELPRRAYRRVRGLTADPPAPRDRPRRRRPIRVPPVGHPDYVAGFWGAGP